MILHWPTVIACIVGTLLAQLILVVAGWLRGK